MMPSSELPRGDGRLPCREITPSPQPWRANSSGAGSRTPFAGRFCLRGNLPAGPSPGGRVPCTAARDVSPIVDRIGTGDAFAAGVLHGGLTSLSAQEALDFGVAAACLKHSLPGDFNLVGADDVRALLGENALDVKR